MDQDREALKAAAFMTQALALDIDPLTLATEMTLIERDAISAVYTAKFDSSVGTAAFLVYVFTLHAQAEDGHTGQDAFTSALDTLQTAAERDAPGPRVVAHASSGEERFILATTPATARALAGETPVEEPERGEADLSTAYTARARRQAAGELLRLLRAANSEATVWLAAIRAGGRDQPNATDLLTFDDVETELALYLLDERSIQNLLRALNLFLTAARANAPSPTGTDPSINGNP